ncbi:MAG: hypothetical protein KY453_04615 [Gemmatimonadetes bacterium]|nr:hypothetical protein [Gemmatimonadota bacterium]
MARDHAFATTLAEGVATLRLYGWSRPTLSLGRNELAVGIYDRRGLRGMGVDVVRRPTGGRAVLHHRELTYAVILAPRALGGPRAAYGRVSEAIVRGLSFLGVEAEIARGGAPASAPDAGPCFQTAADGEVVAGGRKLAGSAQARLGGALLQHGSILLDDDQDRVALLAHRPSSRPPATLRELLGVTPDPRRVTEAVLAGFRATLPGVWTDEPADVAAADEAELEERYRSDAWTWRR